MSAIMFDVDHFKRINDTHGHEIGDQVLAAVAAEAKLIDGKAGRLGGEEFCILISSETADALECASSLQQSIRALRFGRDDKAFAVTCSFGIAEWEAGDAIDRLLRRADIAMYQSKKTGRDRITAADSFAPTKDDDERNGATRADGVRA